MKKKLFIFMFVSICTLMIFQSMDTKAAAPNPCYMIGDVEYCPPPTPPTPEIYGIDMDGRSGESGTYRLSVLDTYTFNFTPEVTAYYKLTYNLGVVGGGDEVPVIRAELYDNDVSISRMYTMTKFNDWNPYNCGDKSYHFVKDTDLADPRTADEEFYLEANHTYKIEVEDGQYGMTNPPHVTTLFNIKIEGEKDLSTKLHPTEYFDFVTKGFIEAHYRESDGEISSYTHHIYEEYLLNGTIDYAGDVDYYKIKLPISKLLKFVHSPDLDIRLLNSSYELVPFSYQTVEEKIFGLEINQDYILEIKHSNNTISSASYSILITDRIYEQQYKVITYSFEDSHIKYNDNAKYLEIEEITDLYFDDYQTASEFAIYLQGKINDKEVDGVAISDIATTFFGIAYPIPGTVSSVIQALLGKDASEYTSIISQVSSFAGENSDGKVHIRINTTTSYTYDDDDNLNKDYEITHIEVTDWDGVIMNYPIFTADAPPYNEFVYINHTLCEYEDLNN